MQSVKKGSWYKGSMFNFNKAQTYDNSSMAWVMR
jgi:hypothetical protein